MVPQHAPKPSAETRAAKGEPSQNLKSLFKIIDILECFSTVDRELSVSEIARRANLPKSTAHRILDSLRAVGLLEQEGNRDRYHLGLKLFEFGSTALANMRLHREARPFIESLSKLSGEAVHLCVFNGTHMLLVKKSERASSPQNTLTTMEASTCHSTGVGKATLAFQSEAVIDKVVRLGLTPHTPSTITDPHRLREELALIRERAYAIDNGEHDMGVRCVAAPIRNASGRVFAAISVSGPSKRITDQRITALATLVKTHAALISAQLGFTPKNRDLSATE
ncbi:MAG: IclR family transcriptional regulator [Acetobacteraceae bacterium]|nr:IclR family transcriptional regulator [Acetobacteraceae bacterium]